MGFLLLWGECCNHESWFLVTVKPYNRAQRNLVSKVTVFSSAKFDYKIQDGKYTVTRSMRDILLLLIELILIAVNVNRAIFSLVPFQIQKLFREASQEPPAVS